jgi:hypothetical protein
MDCVSCLPAPFSGRHTHRSGRNQKPVVLRSASAAPSGADREPKLAGSGRLRPKRAGPAVRIHLAPPTSQYEPTPSSGIKTKVQLTADGAARPTWIRLSWAVPRTSRTSGRSPTTYKELAPPRIVASHCRRNCSHRDLALCHVIAAMVASSARVKASSIRANPPRSRDRSRTSEAHAR